jgi:hypothetical protein
MVGPNLQLWKLRKWQLMETKKQMAAKLGQLEDFLSGK